MTEDAEYLEGLNRCFPGWGGAAMFDWAFRRVVDGAVPDLLTVREGGRLIGGSALTYRRVQRADGTIAHAAFITASWVIPEAQGRGIFTRLLRDCCDTAARRGLDMLLAFVTATNRSASGVASAGFHMIPSFYCRPPRDERPAFASATVQRSDFPPNTTAHLDYTDDEWRAQFLDRPAGTRAVGGDDWRAVLEDGRVVAIAGADEVSIVRALAALNAFTFTLDSARATALAEVGFEIKPGFFAVLPIGGEPIVDWSLQNGDRM